MRRGVLERPDAQVAAGYPDEDRTRQQDLASDGLAGRDNRQGTRRRDPQRVHRLRHEVLAQHRAEGGLAVAAAGVRRRTRTLEVDVTTPAVTVDELAEQERSTVTEAR